MRSLDRAIEVLEVLENAEVRLRLSEISKRCNLHIATTQRILNALERRGRVDVNNGGYAIGLAAVVGAHSYAINSRIIM
ncbi:MAG: helix-turn-helix domain-containing protein, partial [Microbacteriaceae bacterium]